MQKLLKKVRKLMKENKRHWDLSANEYLNESKTYNTFEEMYDGVSKLTSEVTNVLLQDEVYQDKVKYLTFYAKKKNDDVYTAYVGFHKNKGE